MGRLAVSKRHEKRVGVEARHVLRIRQTANKETMWMLMRNKPTRYHSDNDTNTAWKHVYSLLKLRARIPSSSTVVRPHPFVHSCVFPSLGRVSVGGETLAAPTFTSGSMSTMLTIAFPSKTRWILSASQVGVTPLGFAPFDGESAVKAFQKALPSC